MTANIWTATAEPFISQHEERQTLGAARAGDDAARERLVRAYLPALRKAVHRLDTTPHFGLISEDARQAAILGLFEALAAWDASTGRGLAGLVPLYVKGALSALTDGLYSHGIPERTRERYSQVMRAASGFADVAAALAPDYDMTERTFWDIYKTHMAFSVASPGPSALRAGLLVEESDPDAVSDRAEGGAGCDDSPWDVREFGAVEDAILSAAALGTLDASEREIVALSYGFASGEPLSVRDVAARVGLSKSSVSRTLTLALDKMRQTMGATV